MSDFEHIGKLELTGFRIPLVKAMHLQLIDGKPKTVDELTEVFTENTGVTLQNCQDALDHLKEGCWIDIDEVTKLVSYTKQRPFN